MNGAISNINSPARTKRGFSKVQGTCALAIKDGFDWVWIDSCCIDKSSSTELQEAINSMFRWYQEAQICYAYLSDVPDDEAQSDAFRQSSWFTRGWTLQELLAPYSVEFYAADWTLIGSKASRAAEIAHITGIDLAALQNHWFDWKDKYSAAEKMSWAAHRVVTRSEDVAYCLLGFFDANMPLLYGEGERRAFRRLQQAVFHSEADYTLLLFVKISESADVSLLANSARQFCRKSLCKDCTQEPTYLPGCVAYSQIRSALDAQGNAFSDPSLRLVKGGVKLSVPRIEIKSGFSIKRFGSIPETTPGETNELVALLPLTLVGCESHLFGIILTSPATSSYARCHAAPILVDMSSLSSSHFDPKTFIVIDNLKPSADAARKYVFFELRSSTFQMSSWTCTTDDSHDHPWRPGTIIANTIATSDRFALTMRLFSTSSRLSPIIVLDDSRKELRLQSVEMQGDGPTPRLTLEQNNRIDQMTVPLVTSQGCVNVALRRLRITIYFDDIDVNSNGERYRVEVEYVGNTIHDSELGKAYAETGDMNPDETSVYTTAAG